LFDTTADHEGISHLVIQAVGSMYPEPHALLYVVRIGRYTEEEYGAYRRFKALFGESVTQHMILLFTGGDSLGGAIHGAEASAAVVERINERGPVELQEVYRECGQRVVVFDNTARDTDSQVQYLVQEVRDMLLKNGGRSYTCPLFVKLGLNIKEEVARRVQQIEREDAKKREYVQQLERETLSVEELERTTRDHLSLLEEERKRKQRADAQAQRRMEKDYQHHINQMERVARQQQAQMSSIQHDTQQRVHDLRARERAMRDREHEREMEREEQRERNEEMIRRVRQQADEQRQQQEAQIRRMRQKFQ
jgi:hypothetical protein